MLPRNEFTITKLTDIKNFWILIDRVLVPCHFSFHFFILGSHRSSASQIQTENGKKIPTSLFPSWNRRSEVNKTKFIILMVWWTTNKKSQDKGLTACSLSFHLLTALSIFWKSRNQFLFHELRISYPRSRRDRHKKWKERETTGWWSFD